MVFTVGVIILFLLACLGRVMMVYGNPDDFYRWYFFVLASIAPIIIYSLVIFTDSAIKNRSLPIGFIVAWWKRCVLKKDLFQAFEKSFYD